MDKCPKNKEYECSEERIVKCRQLSDEEVAQVCGGNTEYSPGGSGSEYGQKIVYQDVGLGD